MSYIVSYTEKLPTCNTNIFRPRQNGIIAANLSDIAKFLL